MPMNKSAIGYRRLKNVRVGRSADSGGRGLPDLPETAHPRFQRGILLSNERGQQRMSTWTKLYD
jgi:hypothetical protein